MCNATNLPQFVLMVNTFRWVENVNVVCAQCHQCARIIVLTYNRPRSLLRLLRSLEAAHYTFPTNNPAWDIILEIRVDGGGGQQGHTVKNVARQ